MKKDKKVILLFSDLEGTILREEDGDYNPDNMNAFLTQIDQLQQLTNARVNLHLVSPLFKKYMAQIADKIDRNIIRYNISHRDTEEIPEIESATYSTEYATLDRDYLDDKLVPLKLPIDSSEFDTSIYGKANYVKTWCNEYNQSGNLLMVIYCGNGRNDLSAMDYVRHQKRGFVLCPSNSRTKAKEKAAYVSSKTDLLGIADGIKFINDKIREKMNIKKDNKEEDKSSSKE